MRIFKTLMELLRLPSDLDSFLKIIGVGGGVSAVTGWLAYYFGEKAHWVIIIVLMSLALVMIILLVGILIYRKTSVFQQIRVSEMAPLREGTGPRLGNKFHLTMFIELFNGSERNMYYRLKRSNQTMQAKSPPKNELDPNVNVIQPRSSNKIVLASIDDIDTTKPIEGRIELEVLYGPEKERLPYVFSYVGDPQIIINIVDDGKAAQVSFVCALKKAEHGYA